ncbi:MAG TPA: 16S rRNA (adenine(1518)-N(6)/adenine(1519)-N(6))-dimethyltransferase RsmA [Candidatus Polarisedimenticolaceae bacterium]|nr:16S rRNA (adenine(1518)-N(6)/adenine(1519)-N(6))-dimethyltransferase RsmA [Candidatus Polarisedimenticolaceae bacterium]
MPTLYEEVRAALRECEFRPRKRLGQNFLVHDRVLEAILDLLDLKTDDLVLEIGPGLGALTRRLVDRAARVWAVEVDPFLIHRLQQSDLIANRKFDLVSGDILKVPLAEILPKQKIKLIGNLPYSISTPVLFRVFELRDHFSSMVLMVQKEVADRIASVPGTKNYGTLSVWCQIHGQVTKKLQVAPEAFFPQPKVRSTVLKMELYPQPRVPPGQITVLRGLLRASFGQRRKTLGNVIGKWLNSGRTEVEEFLRSQNIDPRCRGETLSIENFIDLTHASASSQLLRAQAAQGLADHTRQLDC